ncbi:hypothetical protein ACH0B5_02075 [Ureibacillus sp. 179-F W5.1 NHS]|uniref:Uncharacterized protein n=1 Tax=Lysinibacillus halotolerans TaxID=1368476 RepID=A0A3M8HAH8_9BACI|nr:hypothetical protein [Lysinibacillus halotolerans]RNC99386.1 hypothetical protein EC501_07630 [Lysinibacillus halotolerans]
MVQLFFIGIVCYLFLFLLAKLNIFNGLTRILSVINMVIVIGFGLFVLIKTGLLRTIATFISLLIIRMSELVTDLF